MAEGRGFLWRFTMTIPADGTTVTMAQLRAENPELAAKAARDMRIQDAQELAERRQAVLERLGNQSSRIMELARRAQQAQATPEPAPESAAEVDPFAAVALETDDTIWR
jgi:transcription elongation GreA/GreB family factor